MTTTQALIQSADASETPLPDPQPLTLTRNFGLVVAFCVLSLLSVPLLLAWTAGLFLK